jgi:adenine phosphoribosyltransferase
MTEIYRPVTDRSTTSEYLNLQPWWRDSEALGFIGGMLTDPFKGSVPTVVIGPASSGYLVGSLAAVHLRVGFAAVVKDPPAYVDSDRWLKVTTPPDYKNRQMVFGVRNGMLRPSDRVLAVDDVVDTGSQLLSLKRLVELAGASWLGASVVVDVLDQNTIRRDLNLRSVFNGREL